MTLQMKMVVVPTCIEQSIKSARQPMSVLLDPKKLLGILSKDDVSFYLYAQLAAHEFLPKELIETIGISSKVNIYSDNDCCLDDIGEMFRKVEGYQLQNRHKSVRPLYDGLFDETVGGTRIEDYAFEVEEIDENTLALRLVPVNNSESAGLQMAHSYDKLFAILRRYIPLDELSVTKAFAKFVQLNLPSAA